MIPITGTNGNAGHALSPLLARRKVPIRTAHSSAKLKPHDFSEDLPHQAVRLDNTATRFFAQNLQGPYLKDIWDNHRIYLPAGSGQVAFIDVRDIVQVAALVLSEPDGRLTRSDSLTGPSAAMNFDKVAALLSAPLDHLVTYDRAGMLAYPKHLRRQQLPWMQILIQTGLHVGLRFGQGATVTQDIPQLLGRNATSLETCIEDHAVLWKPHRSKIFRVD